MAATNRKSSVRKKGYVLKLPVSSGVIKVWAKRWSVLHATTHDGVVRFEYYDNEEAEVRGENKRVILLRNCTGCIETTEFRSKPFAFQFSTQQGRHVFAAESKVDQDSWIDTMNDVIREDRMRTKKSVKKNTMAETVMREPGDSVGHAPHVGTLMGVYNVAVNPTDLSKALNLSGTYSLDVTPKGMSLISNSTETELVKWHYKHIKFYAKSSKNVITLEMGRRSPTGEGKFLFQTTVAKELFSMIHRNIKKIRIAHEKKLKEETAKEVERIKELRRAKEGQRQSHTMRPKSMSYELDSSAGSRHTRTLQRQSTIDPFTSASTLGTVADDDLIQLEGLAHLIDDEEFSDTFDVNYSNLQGRNRLSMGATLGGDRLELSTVSELTSTVYDSNPATVKRPAQFDGYVDMRKSSSGMQPIYDEPPKDGFGDSFTDGPGMYSVATDPFSNVTDPFSSSAATGSFYNAEEDIFQTFEQASSPNKTSTPNNTGYHTIQDGRSYNQSRHPPHYQQVPAAPLTSQEPTYSNVTEALRGLKDIQLDTKPKSDRPPVPKPRTLKRPSKQQFDDMWTDITEDMKLP